MHESTQEGRSKQLEKLLTPLIGEKVDVIPLTHQEEADYAKALEDSGPRPPSRFPLILLDYGSQTKT